MNSSKFRKISLKRKDVNRKPPGKVGRTGSLKTHLLPQNNGNKEEIKRPIHQGPTNPSIFSRNLILNWLILQFSAIERDGNRATKQREKLISPFLKRTKTPKKKTLGSSKYYQPPRTNFSTHPTNFLQDMGGFHWAMLKQYQSKTERDLRILQL